MSVQASIEIEFLNSPQKSNNSLDLIKILINNGWTLSDNGGISYLPEGDNDDFDWVLGSKISQEELMKILEEKTKKEELIGIVLTWQNTNIGGSFLFYKSKIISISLHINRKTLSGLHNFQMTDFNWYVFRLIPIFYTNNIPLKSITIDEMK